MHTEPLPVVYRPIGITHSPFSRIDDVPRQPILSKGCKGVIEIYPRFAEGLSDLDGFSHIILVVHNHLALSYSLKLIPASDSVSRGVFATRSPKRPNPIGISVVNLEEIKGSELHVSGIDMIDGTPILDIKPYIPELSRRHGVKLGWIGEVFKNNSD